MRSLTNRPPDFSVSIPNPPTLAEEIASRKPPSARANLTAKPSEIMTRVCGVISEAEDLWLTSHYRNRSIAIRTLIQEAMQRQHHLSGKPLGSKARALAHEVVRAVERGLSNNGMIDRGDEQLEIMKPCAALQNHVMNSPEAV